MVGWCRLKREEDRLKRELEEKEMEEARALMEQTSKGKGKKLKVLPCAARCPAVVLPVAPAAHMRMSTIGWLG